jgi:hypothetical protein
MVTFQRNMSDANDLFNIKNLGLHKIASIPVVLPYYDLVQWIISHTDLSTCTIINSSLQIVGSLRVEDISNKYKLGASTVFLYDSFNKRFVQKEVEGEEIQMVDLITDW